MSAAGVVVIVVGLAIVVMLILALVASMFRKVGPNQALIVFGFGGTKVVVGGGRIIWPMVQQARELSLELMSFDVTPQNDFYSVQGVAVNVEAVAQIKVKSDQISILTAAEQFLNKPPLEREGLIRLVVEGHLRGIIGQLRVEEIVKEPEMVAEKVRSQVADDMSKMGLEVVSFTIKEVRDDNEYILNMGKPDIAAIKRQAEIASAEADRDIAIRRAQADRDSRIAQAQADQEKVIAETASQTKQAEAFRDLEIKKAEYQSTVKIQQAQADKAYEIQTNIEQQRVIEEEVKIEQVKKQGEVAVQEAEILRREKELIATVLRGAEIERKRIETLAEAERQRQVLQATGQAEAARLEGQAQAEVTKVRGLAEAEIILAKGQAEANSMTVKAGAYQAYNQAAILDKLLTGLPEVVRAMAEPLSKVDKITVVSTGDSNGHGAGINRVTSDMTTMLAQVPALFESLTGVDVGEMMRQVPPMRGVSDGVGGANGVNGKAQIAAAAAAAAPNADGKDRADE
ncbi:MAG: flotillin [Thermomicrobiales bacterium]|jgi:flotillin|nr:flotillin [Thermomicrobiales bacterium]MEA2532124.1 flotillin [Thermomicrobiales bacterium]MEA2594024.1 flotillin [Thermomicrobiales bacterium]